ncbi:Endonuclease IV [Pseudobutyrivibrio sp. NOR37]|uniref:Probable endonuclease 4 n=1 Tax=Pseudobutyrivibrio xylanivorans TaxID=185007 RepID=A0A6M0LDK4_PSEXY|nr:MULTISPECIES: deoxyribonuclease IV [Pseudobutyrivibrio]NEX00536.1 deoxyribonuclease IV [Pseudobutyrivibrio xylanivorans]SFR60710.1 Endonuclease IV [Pseudobutyrivibrio sp. NOR37]
MIYIGCHLSVTNGYEAMGRQMTEFGGNTFAWFTRNPRGGKAKEIDGADVKKLQAILEKEKFGKLVAHASYTMNLCSAKEETRANGLDMLKQDLKRMEQVPNQLYNFHPGSHTGQGPEVGIQQIADGLNESLWPEMKTTVLLETMAGKGSEVGKTFEELREIIDRTTLNEKLGVCLDTCHIWDGGYDIVNDLDGVLTKFDKVIGLDRLKAIHFNDSKNECGAAKDRHEKLGQGCIGMEAMKRIALHPALQNLPFILETPNDDQGYIEEIALVNSWMND